MTCFSDILTLEKVKLLINNNDNQPYLLILTLSQVDHWNMRKPRRNQKIKANMPRATH